MPKALSEMTLEELWKLFPIELTDYNFNWPLWYEEEAGTLLYILGKGVKSIEHIGSTAVKGIRAKPIIDILLQLEDDYDIARLKTILSDNGWILMSERAEPELRLVWNKGYTPEGLAEKVFHLHIRRGGDWDEPRFRDYLRARPEAAAEYEALKQDLAVKYRYNRDAYTEAKGDFIKACGIRSGRFIAEIIK